MRGLPRTGLATDEPSLDPGPPGNILAGRSSVDAAAALAAQLLRGDAERLAHSAAVARRAEELSATVGAAERDELVSAAWLHDIGYSPSIRQTGFHPVDGARYLRRSGWPVAIQELVAHHSGSRFVARVRKLEPGLVEFSFREDELSDALTIADQTVGPGGRAMTVEERLADMLRRHGPDSPNALAHAARQPYLLAAARRVVARLRGRGLSPRELRILLADRP